MTNTSGHNVAGQPQASRELREHALENLRILTELRSVLDAVVVEQVDIARNLKQDARSGYWGYQGATWEKVGDALGVTKQAAAARFAVKVH